MQKLLVLNENTTTSRKTKPLLDTLLSRIGISVTQELVDDFERWKSVFIEANKTFDVIYLQTRGAIKNWDHDEALRIIDQHIKVPLVTCEDFHDALCGFWFDTSFEGAGYVGGRNSQKNTGGYKSQGYPNFKESDDHSLDKYQAGGKDKFYSR